MKLKYRIVLGLTLAGSAGMAIMFAVMMVYYTIAFPDPLAVRKSETTPVIRILARDGSLLASRGTAHDYLPLEAMAKVLPAAVVATEDRRFFDHYGIDPAGTIRAMFANLRAGRFVQGGSTLTQQLAKNLFLTPNRTLSRKIAEAGLALWLEMRLTKAQILELYLNQVYFGAGAYGAEAASRRYFNKSARDLTLAEAAVIAGLLKAPSRYSPANNPEAARARGKVVLDRMVDAGFITEAQKARALARPVIFSDPVDEKIENDSGYVVDYVLDRLPPMIGDGHAELVIETTLDPNLQRHAQQIVKESLDRRGANLKTGEAALVVLDRDGGIRALVGGRDYAKSQFDRAVKAHRQPGSAFKPFVYLAAIEHGLAPDSIELDAPIRIGNWSPNNDDGKFAGPVTLRRALAQSINTVAVRLNESIGRGKAIEVARRLGIKSELRDGPSLPLGTSEVTLLELTGAYTAFSNGGRAVEPHVISLVRTGAGRVLFQNVLSSKQVIGQDQLGALNDMMNAVVVYGTGKRAALPDRPAGGKTGTTQDFRDAWFIGYTSNFTAGVWVGNDDGKPMNHTTGGSLPAEIWQRVMQVANHGMPSTPLPGTALLASDSSASDSNGLVRTSSARAPRVIQIHEELPWLARLKSAYGLSSPRQAISAAPTAYAPRPSHPVRNIGEDFIEHAIAGTDAGDPSVSTAGSRPAEAALEPAPPTNW